MEYEETPLIEPIKEIPQQPKQTSFFKKIIRFMGNLILFGFLFVVGLFFGAMIPEYLPATDTKEAIETATPTFVPIPTVPTNPVALWNSYSFAGISYKLPSEILAPVCDSRSCTSQGTYLPGGSRFTVSSRPTSLAFMRTATIIDAGGRAFVSREATVSGIAAIEYSGSFRGTTTGGYTFSQMRGVMIEVSSSQSVEINHFAPSGVTVDFEADDALFNQILTTARLP